MPFNFQAFEKKIVELGRTEDTSTKEVSLSVAYIYQMLYENNTASEIDYSRFSIEDICRAQTLLEENAVPVGEG